MLLHLIRICTDAPDIALVPESFTGRRGMCARLIDVLMYPEKLIKPCILAGSPVSGIVLDLFFGSRTTGAATKKLGRHYLGIELKPEYCDAARQRIEKI